MADESFDSEALSGQSEDCDSETKNQSDKEKGKAGEEEEDDEISAKNKKLITSISKVLTAILEKNKKLKNYTEIVKKQSKMIFSSPHIPNITISDYLSRIQIYSRMEKSTLILSLIQIDHICKKANLFLTYFNIHRLLFGAVLISIKFNEDTYYDNLYYSEIAGVKLKELKMIEYTFMELSNFNVFVDHKEYEQYQKHLEKYDE